MYIYQSMPDGIVHGPDGESLTDQLRIIEVEGEPSKHVGIRYKSTDEFGAPIGVSRTASGKLGDSGSGLEDLNEQQYWADKPSGFLGGRRLKETLAEDIAVRSASQFFELVLQFHSTVCPGALHCVQESNKEVRTVWNMFKEDPLSPLGAYWRNFGMPGIGLFLEGYVVSSLLTSCT